MDKVNRGRDLRVGEEELRLSLTLGDGLSGTRFHAGLVSEKDYLIFDYKFESDDLARPRSMVYTRFGRKACVDDNRYMVSLVKSLDYSKLSPEEVQALQAHND